MRNIFSQKNNDESMGDQVLELYNAIEESHFTVAITGAGISLSAGGISFDQMLSSMGPGIQKNRRRVQWQKKM